MSLMCGINYVLNFAARSPEVDLSQDPLVPEEDPLSVLITSKEEDELPVRRGMLRHLCKC